MKQRIISKGLVVAVIILFLGLGVQPAIANMQKEVMIEPYSEPIGEPKWLANMQVEFRDKITNEKIIWEPKEFMPAKNYYVHIDVKFRCLQNRKIVINY
jgi:hypothetical protein